MRQILLAYDGSEPSRHAAAQAVDLARRAGAEVLVVMVGELAPSAYGAVTPVIEPEAYQKVLAEVVEQVRREGVRVEGELVWGTPGEKIIRLAEERGCGMIVLGRRGRGGLASLFPGSVAKYVMDHAPCSVLVVR